MASGTFYPAANADDGYWIIGGAAFEAAENSNFFGRYTPNNYAAFIRFANVTIPKNYIINSAFIKMTGFGAYTATVCNVNIYFNNEDDATNPTDVPSADAKTTTDGINWDGVVGFASGVDVDSPEVKTILQDIVNRAGWSAGNHILALIKEEGESDLYAFRAFKDYQYGDKAELHVEWSAPPSTEIVDLKSEIAANSLTFCDLNTDIAALRSKHWLNTDIQIKIPYVFFSLISSMQARDKSLVFAFSAKFNTIKFNTPYPVDLAVWSKFLLLRYDHVPARNEQNVLMGKAMVFRLYSPDPLFSINLSTFKVRFDEGVWFRYGNPRLTFTKVTYREYLVYFNPPTFAYDRQVAVELYCEDHMNNPGIKLEIL